MGDTFIISALPDLGSPALELARDAGVGAASFTATLLALWLVSGRPKSAERLVLSAARRVICSWVGRPC
ncbi:MAG: hypothetical protein HQL41_17830 [Alphaproteobacteria bacterium]|nr:hypothetical protein [Alphaproteobacteria bacterium]